KTKYSLLVLLICFSDRHHLLAEASSELPPSEVELMTPSLPMKCGSEKSVVPVVAPHVQGEGEGENIESCCISAYSDCADNLEDAIEALTMSAECSGCTCPNCGAISCTPYKKLPLESLFGNGNISYSECTFYPDNHSCRVSCEIVPGFWSGSLLKRGERVKIGCTPCAPGHLPNFDEVTGILLGGE
ncbi:MAG: hypothetical protein KDD55_13835, partial [Bdellovibrionales bacterium]|nr:hypothetical protein [Bdellovibrionales bacterium]